LTRSGSIIREDDQGAEAEGRQQMRIRVVDDSRAIRAIVQAWLVRAGWTVVLAANGDRALKLYRQKDRLMLS